MRVARTQEGDAARAQARGEGLDAILGGSLCCREFRVLGCGAARAPRKVTRRVPRRVEKVWMPYLRSPSTSARSLVIAMTVANTVTKHVMNLRGARLGIRVFPGYNMCQGLVVCCETPRWLPHRLPGSLSAGYSEGSSLSLFCTAQATSVGCICYVYHVLPAGSAVVTAGPREARHSATQYASTVYPPGSGPKEAAGHVDLAAQAAGMPPRQEGRGAAHRMEGLH